MSRPYGTDFKFPIITFLMNLVSATLDGIPSLGTACNRRSHKIHTYVGGIFRFNPIIFACRIKTVPPG